jgi:hypothetical protein
MHDLQNLTVPVVVPSPTGSVGAYKNPSNAISPLTSKVTSGEMVFTPSLPELGITENFGLIFKF